MRVFTSGVKVVDGLFGARLCLLAVCVFVCSIDRSNSDDTAIKDTIEDPVRHPQNSLTVAQLKSAYTIEFDFRHIDKKNRTAMNIAYRDARRKIIDKLKSRKRKASSPTTSTTVAADTTIVATTITTTAETTAAVTTAAVTTAAVTTDAVTTDAVTTTATPAATSTITTLASTTATTTNPTTIVTTIPMEPTTTTAALETTQTTLEVEITTETPTTVSTTTTAPGTPSPERRRKRRNIEENNSTLTDDDLLFVDNGLEIDEDGTLRISFFLNTTEFSEDELLEALKELETEESGFKEIAPVIDIYKGLPPVKAATAGIRVWLPILFAIIILIIIFIIVFCCWKATNKKVKDVEQQKIVPKQDSKPTPSNGHAHPRILDDNSGWLVPYEQFGSEQKI